jgi:hypothetical protein
MGDQRPGRHQGLRDQRHVVGLALVPPPCAALNPYVRPLLDAAGSATAAIPRIRAYEGPIRSG